MTWKKFIWNGIITLYLSIDDTKRSQIVFNLSCTINAINNYHSTIEQQTLFLL